MIARILNVLLITADEPWREECLGSLKERGCDVKVASDGFQATDLLHRRMFDIVIMDDSLTVGPIEFSLTLRDLVPNHPLVILGGNGLDRFASVWSHCGVFHAGTKSEALSMIPTAVRLALASDSMSGADSLRDR